MSSRKIQSLNPNIASDTISMPYPHLRLLEPSDAVALVLPSMESGDLPVICEYEGITRKLGNVRYSALSLATLVKISKLELWKNEATKVVINCVDDVLEAMV